MSNQCYFLINPVTGVCDADDFGDPPMSFVYGGINLSVFHVSVLLLTMNFVITLLK